MTKLPWEVIGPAGAFVLAVLIVICIFLLKLYRMVKNGGTEKKIFVSQPAPDGSTPNPDIRTALPCMDHEGRISSNATMIQSLEKSFVDMRNVNRLEHEAIQKKVDDVGNKIIRKILENNRSG